MTNKLINNCVTTQDKRGFYQVGKEKYLSKFQAILAAQKTGEYPYWNFNDDTFTLYDWTTEPQESLNELYRQRAQQLRDQYDYLVVLFSGGSDSSNVLQSFLFNGIKIDEILCYGPFSTMKDKSEDISNNSENNFREIDLVALPYLRELSKTYKFDVTLYDWTQDMSAGYKDANWIWTDASHRFSASMASRNKIHEASIGAMKTVEQGKTVGFVLGMDKPRIFYHNHTYQTAFLDLNMTMSIGPKDLLQGNNWFVDELFYYTPDLPRLPIKQAHMMKNFFLQNPQLRYIVEDANVRSWAYRDEYYEICKSVCYPNWNRNAFQTKKISNPTLSENDAWYFKSNIDSKQHWLAGLAEVDRLVDKKWLHDGTVKNGLFGSWSKFYNLSTPG